MTQFVHPYEAGSLRLSYIPSARPSVSRIVSSRSHGWYPETQPPRLGRVKSMPLPLSSPSPPAALPASSFPFTPPLDLSLDLTSHTESGLMSFAFPALGTVQIYDPTSHIGDVRVEQDGAHPSLHIVRYIQHIVRSPLQLSTYQHLSDEMRVRVECTFRRRPVLPCIWTDFLEGRQGLAGPSGSDLLLGNTQIWGWEPGHNHGEWILHVADPLALCGVGRW